MNGSLRACGETREGVPQVTLARYLWNSALSRRSMCPWSASMEGSEYAKRSGVWWKRRGFETRLLCPGSQDAGRIVDETR